MDNLARKENFEQVHQLYASVVSHTDEGVLTRSGHRTCLAKQAASCLLKPQAGDRVLLSMDNNGVCYVLAVLEREPDTVCQMDINGPMHLKITNGRLKITSQEGIDMASAKDIRMISDSFQMNAVKGQFSFHDFFYQGSFFQAQIGRIKWIADSIDGLAERLSQRVKRLYRTVDECEHVTAGRVDYLVKKLLSFRSKYTVLTAKEDVKVDGERIHIG